MPGFHLELSNENQVSEIHRDGDQPIQVLCHEKVTLCFHTTPNYPHHDLFESGEYHVFFEGMIYNRSPIEAGKELVAFIQSGNHNGAALFVQELDGEFVFIIRESRLNRCYVINDSWGRLPVYVFQTSQKLIVSRNINEIIARYDPAYEEHGLTQLLLFGYSLGKRTHFENLERLEPNSVAEIDETTFSITAKSYFKLEIILSGKERVDPATVSALQARFDQALINRLDTLKNGSLALSGGLDSRMIAGSLRKLGRTIPMSTYKDIDRSTDLDVSSAEKLVHSLHFEPNHTWIKLTETSRKDLLTLAFEKQGFNSLSMAFLVQYWRQFGEKNLSILTGDGGGKFFVDLSPMKRLRSEQQLLQYLLRFNALCTLEEACALTGVSQKEAKQTILDHFRTYPCSDYSEKYVYFTLREGGINWAFEGEDRNRKYAWSTSPFYSPDVIRQSMQIPMKSKAYGGLYAQLYAQLPGEMNRVLNPNWNEAVERRSSVKRIHFKQRLKYFLPNRFSKRKKMLSLENFVQSELLKEKMKSAEVGNLNPHAVMPEGHVEFYWLLLTLALRKDLIR